MSFGEPSGGFRSFGDPCPPPPEPEPQGPAGPVLELPVRFVIDRQSLAQLGYEVAAVVAAAVQDGIRAGIDPDGDTLPVGDEDGDDAPTFARGGPVSSSCGADIPPPSMTGCHVGAAPGASRPASAG